MVSALQPLEEEDPLLLVSASVADRFAAQTNWVAAAKVYCELAEDHPQIPVLHWNAALALERAGYSAEAIASLRKVLAIEPASAPTWRKLGHI